MSSDVQRCRGGIFDRWTPNIETTDAVLVLASRDSTHRLINQHDIIALHVGVCRQDGIGCPHCPPGGLGSLRQVRIFKLGAKSAISTSIEE